MKSLVLAATALAVILAGCSSTPSTPVPAARQTVQATPAPAQAPKPSAAPSAPVPVAKSAVAPVLLPPHLDPNNPIAAERRVYFGFDDASIKSDYFDLIARHGRYLKAHPNLKVRIEGNTDERGSSEYNLALGQKRAQSVLLALKVYGAGEAQMEAISWGKEKPKASGHDESAWAQNRRADVAYPAR